MTHVLDFRQSLGISTDPVTLLIRLTITAAWRNVCSYEACYVLGHFGPHQHMPLSPPQRILHIPPGFST